MSQSLAVVVAALHSSLMQLQQQTSKSIQSVKHHNRSNFNSKFAKQARTNSTQCTQSHEHKLRIRFQTSRV
jgi:hypothetical protein